MFFFLVFLSVWLCVCDHPWPVISWLTCSKKNKKELRFFQSHWHTPLKVLLVFFCLYITITIFGSNFIFNLIFFFILLFVALGSNISCLDFNLVLKLFYCTLDQVIDLFSYLLILILSYIFTKGSFTSWF